jgi:beta-aspartyl-peptidase (threonine type)
MAALIVHGGAGQIQDEQLQERLNGCREAALAGWRILQAGGAALDAVQAAVEALEDNPLFNAGRGSVLNAEGEVQMDASLMDGATLRAGAVGAVRRICNPVRLARKVLDDGRHVLLVAEGARRFAIEQGIPECAEEELIVPRQRERWEQEHGTVGCVAVDRTGRCASATSTGGRLNMLPGRVGDSPLIGSGTYATELGAVSCTGVGEAIIRVGLARTAIELLKAGLSPCEAAMRAVSDLGQRTGADAGLIVVDRQARTGYAHNTRHMPVWVLPQPAGQA